MNETRGKRMQFFNLIALALFTLMHAPACGGEQITVTENGKPVASVKREQIALLFPGICLIDPAKYKQFEDHIYGMIFQEPANAKIAANGEIVPEQTGWKLNTDAFAVQFYKSFYSLKGNVIEVPKTPVYPRVDSELLSLIRTKQIGQYVTYYRTKQKARANNIQLAAKAIDNHVIFPGEIFSFNRVVGKRTEEKGYMKAPEFMGGNLVEGIGGGICQVSSTLFNAADYAGMKILERYSHSKPVPYVPPGRDCTVSWNGPDFVFQNNYNQPVLIRAHAAHGRLAVFLYSSEEINIEHRHVPNWSNLLQIGSGGGS